MQNSKQTKKQVNMDVIRYRIAEMQTCICIVVLTYCRTDLLSYINIVVWNCC